MNNHTFRRAHAGTKPVIRAGSPMLTVDVERLRNASPLQTKNPVSRRGLNLRAVILSSLVFAVAVAILVAATAGGRP